MSSNARASLIEGLGAFEDAISDPAVIEASPKGAFLRRGLAVAVFSLLEGFLLERIEELALFINTGTLEFGDLPEKLQQQSIKNVLEVAAARVRHIDVLDIQAFSRDIGTSLAATTGSIALSPLTWAWKGSNLAVTDYALALKYFHVDSPFGSVLEVSRRLGFTTTDLSGNALNLAEHLKQFADTRHAAAHSSRTAISVMWLGSRVNLVKQFAIGFDALASASAAQLRNADSRFLADQKWCNPSRIRVRSVVERKKDYAEFVEGRANAFRTDKNGDSLYRQAAARSAQDQLLVRIGASGKILNWAFPAVS